MSLDVRCRTAAWLRARLTGLILVSAALFSLDSGPRVTAAEPVASSANLRIRVGISVYDDSGLLKDEERQRYEKLFAQLRERARERFGVSLTLDYRAASYSEVVHWCTTHEVDIAVLSPGAYNELVQQSPEEWRYLCTMGQPISDDKSLDLTQKSSYRFEYGLKCVVKRGSRILKAARRADTDSDPGLRALETAFNAGEAALYFVDPLSVSGGIAPLYLLRTQGAGALKRLTPRQVEYTKSHSRSLGIVAEQIPDNSSNFESRKERVAFVWDGAALKENPTALETLPLEMFRTLRIPESAIVVSRALYDAPGGLAGKMLEALHQDRPDFQRVERHEEKYGAITRWRSYITQMQDEFEDASDRYAYEPVPGYERADWTAFFRELDSYVETHDRKPRIAVVFGGGGAKCAYQAGAMEVLERKLREDRIRRLEIQASLKAPERPTESPGYDISLVVGTSGGALNALPVALGISKTEEGMRSIQETWRQLDGRDIINPEMAIRVSVGGWLFILHLVLLVAALRIRLGNRALVRPERRFRLAYRILIVLGVLHVVSWGLNLKWPWFWLSWINYNWYPVWIFLASGVSVCGALLAATGIGMWAYDRFLSRETIVLSSRFVREAVVAVTLVFLIAEIPIALFCSSHVSDDHLFERQIQRLFVNVLKPELEAHGRIVDNHTSLSELSRAIFEEQVLQRDLIISATTLEGIGNSGSQKDIYFCAQAAPKWTEVVASPVAPPAPQFHSLNRESPDQLFDALIGSGTVFPIFPPRKFGPLWRGGHDITLVDGGFSHNNPVEAAVQWGATHIILVKPSQDSKHEEGENLLANAGRAFSHLFEQAQAMDIRAMKETQLFVLRPESESHQIPLLCFASDPIGEVIDMAKKETESNSPFLAKFR